ncbi:carboxylate-amine ligase [Limimaricola cinnabarinus]|jgi:carboxylate-amine ligase|uniref:Putative glutamate--cysteine ligase 2 n=1 Tax=Limimaricola cinnabarinus LL-001 TaxID=1337093 RepID=U3ARI2_9RHOB|nr:carboxylate-amine ligase [Limimaricola cinnabarinus]GAD57333.1 carboxylate-amine ligase bll3764 [Limimaricola cinnabarinus LL-001]
MSDPAFSLGIEEEYLVVDAETMDLAAVPDEMLAAAKKRLGDQVSPEFRDCQIEIGTSVAADIAEARADLAHLRGGLAEVADDHGLALVAVSCHPWGDPESQGTGHAARYDKIAEDIGGIARRLMTCGMHVHVGLGEDHELRADLMAQASYFLPFVLALSASSPYWRGEDTRLSSWRLNIFDQCPRSGLPPRIESWAEYRKMVDALVSAGIIEDASKIWWDLRPSEAWPTLETRIADVMPRMEEALSVAAFVQCVMRMLYRLKTENKRWRVYERFLIEENRWRAQRYGTEGTLLDLGRNQLRPMQELLGELEEMMEPDARALGCLDELRGTRRIAQQGSSATRQRRAYDAAISAGAEPREALRKMLRGVSAEFLEGVERGVSPS